MFIKYEGKPVFRSAYRVKPSDKVEPVIGKDSTSTVLGVEFKHFEPVIAGDYVVRLTEDDTYHCSKAVFEDRNYVGDEA